MERSEDCHAERCRRQFGVFTWRQASADGRCIDAVHLPEQVPVEPDSQSAHGSQVDRNDDRRREDAIRLAGNWRPFRRFTWSDVTQRPHQVVAMVEQALFEARAS